MKAMKNKPLPPNYGKYLILRNNNEHVENIFKRKEPTTTAPVNYNE